MSLTTKWHENVDKSDKLKEKRYREWKAMWIDEKTDDVALQIK